LGYYLRHPYRLRVLLACLADAACIGGAALLGWLVLIPASSPRAYAAAAGASGLGLLLVLGACGVYRPDVLASRRKTLRAIGATAGVALFAGAAAYLLPSRFSGALQAAFAVPGVALPLMVLVRFPIQRLLSSPWLCQRVLVIGATDLGLLVARGIVERESLGIQLVGFLCYEEGLEDARVQGAPFLGRAHHVEKIQQGMRIDRILVACERAETLPADQLLRAKLRGCRVETAKAFYEGMTGRIPVADLQSMELVLSEGFRSGVVADSLKRTLDVCVASTALVLVAPVLALCALAIRFDSKGPVLFRQERVGRGNRSFPMLKLRSMRDGAEDETGPTLATAEDERVTRVGRFLRLTRLDELPQLWNVIVGDMSLVGPRPERREFVELLTEHYPHFRWRSAVRPGITGWAQIRYGYTNELEGFEQKLALDLYYLKHRSLAMDLLILWRTTKTVVLFEGL
jgi:exopolysaccharide biosynthesis polyprenyl glycosylphosphotransferase